MRRPALVSAPPSIAIAAESFGDDAAIAGGQRTLPGHGLEIVPVWQAHPPRRLRRLSAAIPVIVAATATAVWIERGDDTRALREARAAPVASDTSRGQAVVVSAAPARRLDSVRAGR